MRTTAWLLAPCAVFGVCALVHVPGCAHKGGAPTTRPATAAERSERALRDPFRYSPGWDDADVGRGGTMDLDRKGLQKDLEHVFMP